MCATSSPPGFVFFVKGVASCWVWASAQAPLDNPVPYVHVSPLFSFPCFPFDVFSDLNSRVCIHNQERQGPTFSQEGIYNGLFSLFLLFDEQSWGAIDFAPWKIIPHDMALVSFNGNHIDNVSILFVALLPCVTILIWHSCHRAKQSIIKNRI